MQLKSGTKGLRVNMLSVQNNTRRYFRSAVLAFPNTAEYGAAITVPYKRSKWKKLGCKIFVLGYIAVVVSMML